MNTKDIGRIATSAAVSGALLLGGSGLAFAQTYGTGASVTGSTTYTNTAGTGSSITGTSTTHGATSTTPGVPNTGAGGNAAVNFAVLGAAALVAAGGAAYLARKRHVLR